MATAIDLTGRVVLGAGGARGGGRGITPGLTRAGGTVVIGGRTEPESAAVEFVACDVRDAEQVDAMVASLIERHGRLDVVVNNAGGSPPAEAATASPRFSSKIVDLNLLGPL